MKLIAMKWEHFHHVNVTVVWNRETSMWNAGHHFYFLDICCLLRSWVQSCWSTSIHLDWMFTISYSGHCMRFIVDDFSLFSMYYFFFSVAEWQIMADTLSFHKKIQLGRLPACLTFSFIIHFFFLSCGFQSVFS